MSRYRTSYCSLPLVISKIFGGTLVCLGLKEARCSAFEPEIVDVSEAEGHEFRFTLSNTPPNGQKTQSTFVGASTSFKLPQP